MLFIVSVYLLWGESLVGYLSRSCPMCMLSDSLSCMNSSWSKRLFPLESTASRSATPSPSPSAIANLWPLMVPSSIEPIFVSPT